MSVQIRIVLTMIALLLLACVPCVAQTSREPRFGDYPSRPRFPSQSARLNINSTPYTHCFRTMLRDATQSGDKFAGHYKVVSFGCGTECILVGITDLVSGRTYISPFVVASAGMEVKQNSKLLIANSPKNIKELYGDDAPSYVKTRYFIWNGLRLEELDNGKLIGEPKPEFDKCSEIHKQYPR